MHIFALPRHTRGRIEISDASTRKRAAITLPRHTRGRIEIIEIHPFISVGLYSTLWSDRLLNAYADGIKVLIAKV